MEFIEYAYIARRYRFVIIGAALLGLVIAIVLAFATVPQYRSTTGLILAVQTEDDASVSDVAQANGVAQQRVQYYPAIAVSTPVLESTIADLSLDLTAGELASKVSASNPSGALLIDISVLDPSPTLAAKIATTMSANFIRTVELIEGPGQGEMLQLRVIQKAEAASSPENVSFLVSALAGLIAGLGAGLIFALLLHVLDGRVRSLAQLRSATALPVLAAVGQEPLEEHSLPSFIQVANYVRSRSLATGPTSVSVWGDSASSVEFAGQSLGRALALGGSSVLLVDFAARDDSVSASSDRLSPAPQDLSSDGLSRMSWISDRGRPLNSRDLSSAWEQTAFDYVVAVAAARSAPSDKAAISGSTSMSIGVAELGVTRLRDLDTSLESDSLAGGRTFGFIAVETDPPLPEKLFGLIPIPRALRPAQAPQ